MRRRFKDLDRKSDGRSIYLYIYHDSGDVDLLTEASLKLGPIKQCQHQNSVAIKLVEMDAHERGEGQTAGIEGGRGLGCVDCPMVYVGETC